MQPSSSSPQQQAADQAEQVLSSQGSQGDCRGSPRGSPTGANDYPSQKIINKPSDENQRHSNKVEAIEVRLNTDFYTSQVGNEGEVIGHDTAVVSAAAQQQQDLDVKQAVVMDHGEDEPMHGSNVASGDASGYQQHHQYTMNLVRMGMNDRLGLPEPGEEYDQFASGTGPYHSGGYKLQGLDRVQVVDDVDSPGGYGGNGEANPGGASSMFVDSVGGQVDQDVGQVVHNSADTGQNDKRFYSLAELAEMEPMFERQFYNDVSGTNQHNAHVLLSPQEYRAKLYWLDPENRWKDIGTGRFRLLLSKDQEEHYIQVVSEDCMEDQMALDSDINIDKVVSDMIPGQGDGANSQSPQGANGQGGLMGGGPGHVAPKQEFLHRCFVFCLQEFSRQGDTIITWQDDYKNEFALSFQDEKGAQNTWWSICFLKGIQINSNIDEPNEAGGSSETNSINGNGVVLPTKENLAELANDLFSPDAYTRRSIAEAVLKQEESMSRGNTNGNSSELSERDHTKLHSWRSQYLDKLHKIFTEVEYQFQKAQKAMEDNEGDEHDRYIHMQQQVNHLHSLFQIFRNLLNLNQSELLEVLLNENYWLTTFGALEYDPEVFSPLGGKYDSQSNGARSPVGSKPPSSPSMSSPNSNARSYGNYDHFELDGKYNSYFAQEADFREFLSSKVKFKQAVTIEDPQVINSIHLSYKLQYLKDTAMARFIDENTSHSIMQLVSMHHQIILDYIFGEDFERIQTELITKMRDNSNVQDKENALKFFLEICALLKSINLTNRQLQTCNQAFLKIMQVLAQIFDIMIPDRSTLLAEVKQDKAALIKIFELRHMKDYLDSGNQADGMAGSRAQPQNQQMAQNAPSSAAIGTLATTIVPATKEEVVDHGGESLYSGNDRPVSINSPAAVEGEEKAFEDGLGANNMAQTTQDSIINPSPATVEEYLKNPLHSEDPSMTQIDILKSNSIEIFYNLLILVNNVNHSTIREFLCSEYQKKHNYVFLRHLAQHMMYTSQQGIKVSICEFFKDLTSKETSEMQKNFQQIILFQVVSQFVDFLSQDDSMEKSEEAEQKKALQAKQLGTTGGSEADAAADAAAAETQMKDEELKSQDQSSQRAKDLRAGTEAGAEADCRQAGVDQKVQAAYRKQVDQSRILILQFLNKLIVDNVDSYQLRMFFMSKKVLLKVANCYQYNSIQTNVEVIKFFKAIIQAKDTMSTKYMIQKQIFDTILEIFLNNKTKGNLLHSCILNLFEMLTPAELPNSGAGNSNAPSMLGMGLDGGYGGAPKMEGGYVQTTLLHKLYQKLHESGYVKRVFLNKKYEDGFRKFNRSLLQVLDIQSEHLQSEQESKKSHDRDRSNSQSQSKYYHQRDQPPSRSANKGGAVGARENAFDRYAQQVPLGDQNEGASSDENDENQLMQQCFPGEDNAEDGGDNKRSADAMDSDKFGTDFLRVIPDSKSGIESEEMLCKVGQAARESTEQPAGSPGPENINRSSLSQRQNEQKRASEASLGQSQQENRLQHSGSEDGGRENELMAGGAEDDQGASQISVTAQKFEEEDDDNKDADMNDVLAEMSPIQQDQSNDELQEPIVSALDSQLGAKRASVDVAGHSNRANRSQSPISGHAEQAQKGSPSIFAKARPGAPAEAAQSSPEVEGAARKRRLSSEEALVTGRNVGRQSSSNSNKMHNLSDEASNGKNGGKQAFSESMSNPDLDEIYFTSKISHTPGAANQVQAVAPTGFAFKINPPTQPSVGPAQLMLQRQHSPLGGLYTSKDDSSSPITRPKMPIIKVTGLAGHGGHLKKPHAHKRERGRRASSEQAPERDSFTLAFPASYNDDQGDSGKNEQHGGGKTGLVTNEDELHRQLEQKLEDENVSKPESLQNRASLEKLRRGQTICDSRGSTLGQEAAVMAGIKRTRSEAVGKAGDDAEEDKVEHGQGDDPVGQMLENWTSKRPKLTDGQNETEKIEQKPDEQMLNDDEAVRQLLNASGVQQSPAASSEKMNDTNRD